MLTQFATDPLKTWLVTHQEAVWRATKPRNQDRLIVIQMGLGRDSVAMLCLLAEARLLLDGKPLAPWEVDAIVFSDPGYEWPATYAIIPAVQRFCSQIGVPFFVLHKPPRDGADGWAAWIRAWRETHARGEKPPVKPWLTGAIRHPAKRSTGPVVQAEQDMLSQRAGQGGYHLKPPIVEDYESRYQVIRKADGSCSVNHKIVPSRKFLNDLSILRFGADNRKWSTLCKKNKVKPHVFLLGIAADEANRVETLVNEELQVGYSVMAFPLVEMGIDREAETAILARHGFDHVQKSGCMMCKYQGADWYWALSQTDPAAWMRVIAWEEESVKKARGDIEEETKLGKKPRALRDARLIPGDLSIAQRVEAWREKHPEATVDSVLKNEYKSCKSRYSEGRKNPRCRYCGQL